MMELGGLGEAEFLRHEQEVSWPGIGLGQQLKLKDITERKTGLVSSNGATPLSASECDTYKDFTRKWVHIAYAIIYLITQSSVCSFKHCCCKGRVFQGWLVSR